MYFGKQAKKGSDMNPTLQKFNFPDSLVRDYTHWAVLIRPRQVTLGCFILAEKSNATTFGQLSQESLLEFGRVCRDIEATLEAEFQNEKINYVALMMVDPNVHFHVLPRYSTSRSFMGFEFADTGWPKHPDMQYANEMPPETLVALQSQLASSWHTG
jgi:diadenosine tetraphosphate (Ap4A) HIT family hydrolase